MAKLNLSATTTAAWRETLPEDLQALVPDHEKVEHEQALIALGQELEIAMPRRIGDVILEHKDLLARSDRASFARVVMFAINRTQPLHARLSRLLADEDGGDEGDAAHAAFSERYREMYEVAKKICRSRIVRASNDKSIVSAVDAGVREFSESLDMAQTGGM